MGDFMRFNHLAIIGKYNTPQLINTITQLIKQLHNTGVIVYLDNSLLEPQHHTIDIEHTINGNLLDWLNILDLIIVIGGDGTLLAIARSVADYAIPLLGINQGRLGFMTDIAAQDVIPAITGIIQNNSYTLETRCLLNAIVVRNGQEILHAIALNDIVVSRGAIGHMIEFEMSIDDQFVLSQKSDGVIFATPTGSTAYSLAAGGPIMHPQASTFAIVPICPQSLSNRPLVVHDTAIIEFNLIKNNPTQIHFDGQECFDLQYLDKVILVKHPQQLKLIHPHNYNYYHTLRTKLDWSKRVS